MSCCRGCPWYPCQLIDFDGRVSYSIWITFGGHAPFLYQADSFIGQTNFRGDTEGAGIWGDSLAAISHKLSQGAFGFGSKMGTQNETLVNGTKD